MKMKVLIIISLILTIINLIFLVIILFQMTKATKNETTPAEVQILEEKNDVILEKENNFENCLTINIPEKEDAREDAPLTETTKNEAVPAEIPILEEGDSVTLEKENDFENSLIIDIPKKENAGEDAPPLLVVSDDRQKYVVGVFDGMGGSGSALYEENGETRTGAYLASRVTKETAEQFFKEQINNENFEVNENFIDSLKGKIVEGLKEKLSKQNYEKSNIRSSLVRTFPTTMAIGQVSQHSNMLKLKALWAGDSRIYILSSEKGLVQLTKDDLKLNNDPFQNIENDSPLSNMVYLDGDFQINFQEVEETSPAIFLAATDGCFGFFPTPIHFEILILQTLQSSDSMQEWQQQIIEILKSISGDDCSISLVGLMDKTANFSEFKECFRNRSDILYLNFMKEIAEAEKNIDKQERKKVYEKLWNEYKQTNYSLFNVIA